MASSPFSWLLSLGADRSQEEIEERLGKVVALRDVFYAARLYNRSVVTVQLQGKILGGSLPLRHYDPRTVSRDCTRVVLLYNLCTVIVVTSSLNNAMNIINFEFQLAVVILVRIKIWTPD